MASLGRTFARASTRTSLRATLGSQVRLGSTAARQSQAIPCSRRTFASTAGPEEQGPATAQNLDEAQSKWDAAAAKATATMSEILAKSMKVDGPMTVASYMRAALLDPALGYYASANAGPHSKERHVIGAKGDFVTSPEITQVFGEMFGIYFVSHYGDMVRKLPTGTPSPPVRLVEFGPGRGTLLQDILRTWQRFPALSSNLQAIHLVEASGGLRRMQLEAVKSVVEDKLKLKVIPILPGQEAPMYESGTVQVQWFDSIHSVPIQANRYTMLMAHEFFDALPIHVFQKTQEGFNEVMVNLKDQSASKSGVKTYKASDFIKSKDEQPPPEKKEPKFEYVLSPGPTPWSQLLASRNPRFKNMQPGQQVEISPDAWAAARKVGELVAGREAPLPPIPEDGNDAFSKEIKAMMLADAERRTAARAVNSLGGIGAIIDYGDEKSFHNSFRAFKGHQIVDPLESPGSADLTANVDFLHVKHAIDSTDAKALGPAEQGPFLAAMGLELRVNKLLAAAPQDRRDDIFQAAHRVIDMNSMGKEYKVLGVKAPGYIAADDKKGVDTPLYPFEYPEEGEQPPIVEAEGSQYS